MAHHPGPAIGRFLIEDVELAEGRGPAFFDRALADDEAVEAAAPHEPQRIGLDRVPKRELINTFCRAACRRPLWKRKQASRAARDTSEKCQHQTFRAVGGSEVSSGVAGSNAQQPNDTQATC